MANVAISLGITVATNFLLGLFRKDDNKKVETGLPKSEFGQPIWRYYGIVRKDGLSCFWAPEIEQKQPKRGKGGGGGQKEVEFRINAAFLIGDPISAVRRIWINGKLAYSTIGGDIETEASSNKFLDRYCDIYLGDQTTADGTILSYEDDSPAFLGRSYLVLRDYPTSEFGGGTSLPKVDVEVIGVVGETPTLQHIYSDICIQAGLESSEFNVSALENSIVGIPFKNDGSYRDFLEQLSEIYQVITYEKDGVLYFLHQRQPEVFVALTTSDLAAKETDEGAKDRYIERTLSDREVPSKVEISFRNIEKDHDEGYQFSYDPTRNHDNPVSISTDWVATDNEALTQSVRLLAQLQLAKTRYEKISLLPTYLGLTPGQVVNLPIRGGSQPIQIEKVNIGANYLLEIEGYLYGGLTPSGGLVETDLDNVFTTTQSSGISYTSHGKIVPPSVATPVPLDLPLLSQKDSEKGLYIAISAPDSWVSGQLFYSTDDVNYLPSILLSGNSVIGSVSEALPGGYEQDGLDSTSFLTVTLSSGQSTGLEPSTQAEFDAGLRFALVGEEIIVFRDATEISPGVWQISYFKRGHLGTATKTNIHTTNERFVYLSGNLFRQVGTSEDLNRTIYFKVVTTGQILEDVPASSIFVTGESLRPLQVKNISAQLDSVEDLLITWDKQDRLSAPILSGEEVEIYDIEIRRPVTGGLVRRVTSNTSQFVYRKAERDTDSITTDFDIFIYKISSLVGRGYEKSQTPIVIGTTISKLPPEGFLGIPTSQGTDDKLIADFDVSNTLNSSDLFLISRGGIYQSAPYSIISDFVDLSIKKLPTPESVDTTPYILVSLDSRKEKIVTTDTTIRIPDASSADFEDFICIVSLDSDAVITFEAEVGATPTLIFTGGSTFNKLRRVGGSVTVRHRGANTWKIEGALEE